MKFIATHNTGGVNTAKFFAEEYGSARPLYPSWIFEPLRRLLGSVSACEKESSIAAQRFLDLACGTGQSTRSFLDLGITDRGYAVDPDPAMLAVARSTLAARFPEVSFLAGSAESIPLPTHSIEYTLVGSALHWFEIDKAKSELERVLVPGGLLFVYEYQFPVAIEDAELNEKMRRRFNLEWKAPVQKPRGRLLDVLEPFRASPAWDFLAADRPDWKVELTYELFLGHIFSQSRYLHAESAHTNPTEYREEIRREIRPHFRGNARSKTLLCDFRARSHLLRAPGASVKR